MFDGHGITVVEHREHVAQCCVEASPQALLGVAQSQSMVDRNGISATGRFVMAATAAKVVHTGQCRDEPATTFVNHPYASLRTAVTYFLGLVFVPSW